MDSIQPGHVLTEVHIATASLEPSGTGAPQLISAATCNTAAIKSESSILLTNLDDLLFEKSNTYPLKADIKGVAVSPNGSLVAAFTADGVYVAQLTGTGQLSRVAEITGTKAVHWCPESAVLAIICQQVEPLLLVLPQTQGRFTAATAVPELQCLSAPTGVASGAKCAAWLPRQRSSATTALLAAWPSTLLMYCWSEIHGSLDWAHPQVHSIATGWPGPVRALTAVAADDKDSNNSSCLVLGTVDARLTFATNEAALTEVHQQRHQAELIGSSSKASPAPDELINPAAVCADGVGSGGSVLSSLMNIWAEPQQQSTALPLVSACVAVDDHNNGCNGGSQESATVISSSAGQLNCASLCMMHIDLAEYATQPQIIGSSCSKSTGAATEDNTSSSPGHKVIPLSTNVLPLSYMPLPNLLSVLHKVVAVGSTKGPPQVTLCSFSSSSGLKLLQTISIPLPTVAGPQMSKLRLQGLQLVAAAAPEGEEQQRQQEQGWSARAFNSSSRSSSSSSSNFFPGVDLTAAGAALPPSAAPVNGLLTEQQRVPDVVALVTCLAAEQPAGHFANFGSSSGRAAAVATEMHLLKCRVPRQQQQAHSLPAAATSQRHHCQPDTSYLLQQTADQPAQQDPPLVSHRQLPSSPSAARSAGWRPALHSQQQQQHTDVAPSPSVAASLCPWAHDLEQDEEPQQQRQKQKGQQRALANKQQQQQQYVAACSAAGMMLQQQLQVIQQQLDSILQQQAVQTNASNESLNKLIDCLTGIQRSLMNKTSNTQYLDATVDALSKMQNSLHCMMQVVQQQQQQSTVSAEQTVAAPDAPATTTPKQTVVAVHKMQATLEQVLAALLQQQQHPGSEPYSQTTQAASSAAAAFGTLQAAIERLTDTIIQQQQQQQQAIQTAQKQQAAIAAAGLANLQVSLETKLNGMHQTLKELVSRLAGLEQELAELEQS